ncbi:transketolase [Gudongella oleilytica]|jgi:transketolase|uniref:transketolase n=1 Tax=Gudongella oleilytica TaxID=1582259 RepID=UPI000FF8B6AD|nr:transketolase [Gudongella oleilytica]MDY0256457.1 transketolase [Gudongella oleilytica]
MNIDQRSIDTIRMLSAEAVEKAKSGHPGMPLGAAPMAYTLWSRVMDHNGKNPTWFNRDRFILSAGHGSMLLYSMLHLFGYGLEIEDLKNFRQLGSKTPGHPEYGHTKGVEATTGPLGQGISTAVGMAMAEAHMAAVFNTEDIKVIDHYTYVIAGDGDLMEGISNEASSLAGTLGLGKLIVLYDSNSISIEGSTDLAFTEKVRDRYTALGWDTHYVGDGTDIEAVEQAILAAKAEDRKPSLIEVRTNIGYGTEKQDSASAHGEPLGSHNLDILRKNLGWELESFKVPDEVRQHMDALIERGMNKEKAWNDLLHSYSVKYPEKAKELDIWLSGEVSDGYLESEEFWSFEKGVSTREASGILINRLAERLPSLFGGSADLAPSNKTNMKNRTAFSREDYSGSNIHFGVREHAMGAILNGLALHGGVKPYGGTFFIFTDYMKPAMRLSSLMELPVTYVLTHDSIGVGEDGPTHQPIEQMAVFRAQPNFIAFRPADARETAAGWYLAMTTKNTPVGLVLTRQNLPLLEGTGKDALKGGYVLKRETGELRLILIATGSETELAVRASNELEKDGIGTRVVSMPSWELFDQQSEEYRNEVLPNNVRARVAIEAATSMGWHKYTGIDGAIISLDTFGGSAPGEQLFEKFGFTAENVVNESRKLLK